MDLEVSPYLTLTAHVVSGKIKQLSTNLHMVRQLRIKLTNKLNIWNIFRKEL